MAAHRIENSECFVRPCTEVRSCNLPKKAHGRSCVRALIGLSCAGFTFGVHRRHYRTIVEARSDVFDYLERFHNPRMHQRLDAQDQKFLALTQLTTKTG